MTDETIKTIAALYCEVRAVLAAEGVSCDTFERILDNNVCRDEEGKYYFANRWLSMKYDRKLCQRVAETIVETATHYDDYDYAAMAARLKGGNDEQQPDTERVSTDHGGYSKAAE